MAGGRGGHIQKISGLWNQNAQVEILTQLLQEPPFLEWWYLCGLAISTVNQK